MMIFFSTISLVLMKNCVFLSIAWITLIILSEKGEDVDFPKTLTKQGVKFSFQVDLK